MIGSRTRVALLAAVGVLALAQSANAATISVDDDGADCPAAPFASVQAAINAAAPGDTVAICPGTYEEGPGTASTNALTINKSLTIKGAGADLVTIQPPVGSPNGRLAANTPLLRDPVGNIATITGTPANPLTVDISGVSFDGNGLYVENGVVFLDAQGSLVRSRVTDVVVSEAAGAEDLPGGYRQNNFGFGVAQVTAATGVTGAPTRPLLIDHTRIDRYNKAGILIDGATGDTTPLTASGVVNQATIRGSMVVGRVACTNFDANGNCSAPALLTTGVLYGQDGLRVTAGSTATVSDTILTQNLVQGLNGPVRNSATNNANLPLGAGMRLIGAGSATVARSNIVDNAYGILNATLDGTTANTASPVAAENNWWGLRTNATSNVGPAISPTTNPQIPENPVNGAAVVDGAGTSSTAVDFFPFRSGPQADPASGQWVIPDAPIPVNDTAPAIALDSDSPTYEHGDTVELTATPADDFGIKKVTFYDGATVLDTDSTPPYTTDAEILAGDACGSRSYSAVAEDSLGQTAADDVEVTVVDPVDNCLAKPTIALTDVPSPVPSSGATVNTDADSPAGVTKVEVFLGTRLVCTGGDGACSFTPSGAEVGDQVLRAVVTDGLGRTAETSTPIVVDRFDVQTITIAKRKQVIKGFVYPPDPPVSQTLACASGAVTVTAKVKRKTVLPGVQLALHPDCSYSTPFSYAGHKKLKITASFGGNSILKPATQTRVYK